VSAELFAAALRIAEDAPSAWMGIPRQIRIGIENFAYVTDGHALLLIRDCDAAPADIEPAPHSTTAGYLVSLYTETMPNIAHVPLREVTAWLGTGHECNCSFCGYESELEPCLFFGQPFDRRLLRDALPRLDELVAVEWANEKNKQLRVTGDGWLMIAMPLREIHARGKPLPMFDAELRVGVA
jgi:hypothetical protein